MTTVDYKSAGVDIHAGNEAVRRIKQSVESTFSNAVLTEIGSFGALYDLKTIIRDYEHPVLVQSIDGVGTKTIVARMMNKFDTLGMDLVSATTNDIIVLGAKPLTLLDYIANDKCHPHIIADIVSGMVQACKENDISLVGGETAEMPGTYLPGEHDLVGVITGVVEKEKAILGKNIKVGDVVLAFTSSGLHTNGYSLARKLIFEVGKYNVDSYLPELKRSVGEALLEPHINYTRPVLHLLQQNVAIKGMAHITGGGLLENIPRILPSGCMVEINKNAYPHQPLFSLLQQLGHLEDSECYRTFNMGVGLIMIGEASLLDSAKNALQDFPQFKLYEIGKVVQGEKKGKIAMTIRIAVVQFPGSNCERETMLAVKRAGMEPVEFLWNEPAERLSDFQGFIIVGGFSYEDRSRAGIIAALDPIMQGIKQQSQLGKPILGICNGAQILVESGLVPGLQHDVVGMALTDNKRMRDGTVLGTGYYNAWINMRLSYEYQLNAFTRHLTPNHILYVPVAHAEGRFIIPPALLSEMLSNGQGVFQYCDASGQIVDEFPINPNGSVDNIAAVSNKAGNVMAMMPHPERTTNGDAIFASMRDYIADGYVNRVTPLHYQKRVDEIQQYSPEKASYQMLVELNITDNQARSVENALRQHGIAGSIKRYTYWEVMCDSAETFEKMTATEVLYNNRKENLVYLSKPFEKNLPSLPFAKGGVRGFLISPKEDLLGRQKQQMFQHHFNIRGISSIKHGILWQVEKDSAEEIIHSHILYNPYAHDCYYY